MKKIAYITSQSPLISIETFILTEMLSLRKLDVNLLIMPRDQSDKIFHREAQTLAEDILNLPWFNYRIAKSFLKYFYQNPLMLLKMINDLALKAINLKVALKNLLVLPKALYLSSVLEKTQVFHIHAHRGSTPSTMAYIISKITGIPWSFTLHRFDIYENNVLKKKVKSASFVRIISEKGKTDLLKIVGSEFASKIKVMHMGVEIPHMHPDFIDSKSNGGNIFTIVVPANLLPVKGHKYLIEACNILVQRGVSKFKCVFYGEGPLKESLKRLIDNYGMEQYINLCGVIPHEQLICMYKERIADIVILPSITTENGEFEGIPVSLMEAMAFGIPVISTNTGSIAEIIGDGSGIMVKDKDPKAIAASIEKLMNDTDYYRLISERGKKKIERNFNISLISKDLLNSFLLYSSN